MAIFRIFIFLLGAVCSRAFLTLDLDLLLYHNPTRQDCAGNECDTTGQRMCDNKFYICVRAVGNTTCLASLQTGDIDSDFITFTADELGILGISNPIQFSTIPTSGELEIYVDVTDDDGSPANDDEVDEITIPLGGHLLANGEFGPNVTYHGICGKGYIQVRTRLTSECPPHLYGDECNTYCREIPDLKVCSYLGERTCLGNYEGDDCERCKTGFYGPTCERSCEPKDSNVSGHYTCNDLGYVVCLPGYTDNSSSCLTCEGNAVEPDCDTCDEYYYPVGKCDTFCRARDDDLGHYNCSETGELDCFEGYTDPTSNCTMCIGNFQEPDCINCDEHFEGPTCVFCEPNYYPKNNCSVMCIPRNDSEGHFTCDPFTGARVCLEGFKDPSSDCITSVTSEGSEEIVGSPGFYAAIILGGLFVTIIVLTILVLSFGRPRRSKYYSGRGELDTQPIVPMEEIPPPSIVNETKE